MLHVSGFQSDTAQLPPRGTNRTRGLKPNAQSKITRVATAACVTCAVRLGDGATVWSSHRKIPHDIQHRQTTDRTCVAAHTCSLHNP